MILTQNRLSDPCLHGITLMAVCDKAFVDSTSGLDYANHADSTYVHVHFWTRLSKIYQLRLLLCERATKSSAFLTEYAALLRYSRPRSGRHSQTALFAQNRLRALLSRADRDPFLRVRDVHAKEGDLERPVRVDMAGAF